MIKKVAVVGGGVSGLSVAYFTLEKGYSVELFESTSQLGGLAASFNFNGLTIEKYYHFICGGDYELMELAGRLGIDDKLRFQPTKTAFYYNAKYYPFGTALDLLRFFPISLISRFKFGINIATSKYSKKWDRLDNISAKEWLIRCLGEKAYHVLWHPLLKVKFGINYDRISAAWVWHRINRVASSRKGLFSKEKMGYFVGGTQTLITALENKIKELGGSIYLDSKVQTIAKSNNTFQLILDSGEELAFERIVLAVPLPVAAETIRNLVPEIARELSLIDFIGIVCGVFSLRDKVTEAFWLNINDPRIEVNGWIEYTNLNNLEEISPYKIVYIPLYVPHDDEWFSKDEDTLRSEFFNMLRTVNTSLTESDITSFRAFKALHAQAICTVGFKEKVPPIKTHIENLFILDSTQLYPSDRYLSGLIGLAEKMVVDYL